MNYTNSIREYLNRDIEAFNKLNIEEINNAMEAIYHAWERGSTIYVMGNGGSAATASHMVCDFNKGVSLNTGRKFKFICLNDNIPIITAIANDISYDKIFELQLKDVVTKDDLVLAISGSGNSKNIVNAVTYAKSIGTKIVGMTGYHGAKLKELADYHLHVPVDDMQVTEDFHMIFVHMMMRLFSAGKICGCK